MKPILQFLINILVYVSVAVTNILGVLWYGKLPKVSIYHYVKGNFSYKESFNDEFIQSRFYPDKKRARDFIEYLYEQNRKVLVGIEIKFYEEGKIHHTQNLYGVISNSLREWEENEESKKD